MTEFKQGGNKMILDDIVAAKKKRLVRHKENVSEQDMKNLALNEKLRSDKFL